MGSKAKAARASPGASTSVTKRCPRILKHRTRRGFPQTPPGAVFCFCARFYAARRFVAQCAGSTGMALPGRRNGRLAGLEKKFFLLILIIPSAPALARGASLIYPKLDYTLLILPILYCVNRAPPENRMIMRFLPFHFCNPLQTDVNRLQTDAFQLQLRAFWMHLRVTSLHPTCTWLRGGCNGKFARIRVWAMENAAVEIRPGKFSATESSGKKIQPPCWRQCRGHGGCLCIACEEIGARLMSRLGGDYSSSFFASSMILAWFICGTSS